MMLKGAVSTAFVGVWESVTMTVKSELPVVVGVPLMIPSLVKVNPGGRFPALMLHVYGCLPPLAINNCR
jgi:hypothetical protein